MSETAKPRRGRARKQYEAPKDVKPVDARPDLWNDYQAETGETVTIRPEPRPDMRMDDPRAEAARRAAEIMDHLGDLDTGTDEFYVDPKVVPAGWTYEWKRWTIFNKEDPTYQVQLARTGWTPVPSSRHPEMMPHGNTSGTIDKKGQRLMERPAEITQRFQEIDKKRARDQMRAKEEQLGAAPAGHFERTNKDKPLANIKKGYEPMPIPRDGE